ncbi:MAG: alpha/beta hydrolase [Bacteroidota bacterium]|nr:alpha/beta hydrolase [Bacteroidota bacterium]
MNKRRWISVILLVFGLYMVGPAPETPRYDDAMPEVPGNPAGLEAYIRLKESQHRIKPDNEARIIWNDSAQQKTQYALVYLHGYSASQKEGDPIHLRFAKEFGCNLFLSRLSDHGIDTTDALYYFTADRVWESAKEALAIGSRIGDKVILMGTSTGGTLGLMLAARYPEKVHALNNLSPNVAINDPAAFILNNPWGLHIARLVMGGKYRDTQATDEEAKYWNSRYRIESLVQLEELLETSMTEETFAKVRQPSLTLYYYKNEEEQDPQVKVSAMLRMHEQLATPDSLKVEKAIPSAEAHVLGSSLTSHDVDGVYAEIEKFAREKLRIEPPLVLTDLSAAGKAHNP